MKIGAGMTEEGAFGLFTSSSIIAPQKKQVRYFHTFKSLSREKVCVLKYYFAKNALEIHRKQFYNKLIKNQNWDGKVKCSPGFRGARRAILLQAGQMLFLPSHLFDRG